MKSNKTTQSTRRLGTNASWKAAALAATMRVASRVAQFTSRDVLDELATSSDVRTHDLRAIGAVMQQARDLRLISSIGLVRRNDRHSRNATTLWQSRILGQPSETTVQQCSNPHLQADLDGSKNGRGERPPQETFSDLRPNAAQMRPE